LKPHPFNIRQRLAARKYRQKEFQSVVRKTEAFLAHTPNDIVMLELRARAFTSLRNWEKGLVNYEKVFVANPLYKDCAFQLARCAIYTKNWRALDETIPFIHDSERMKDIQRSLIKKSESLSTREFMEVVNNGNTITILHEQTLNKWANLDWQDRWDTVCDIDLLCLEKNITGPYLGHVLRLTYLRSKSDARNIFEHLVDTYSAYHIAMWVSSALEKYPNDLRTVSEWIFAEINPLSMPLGVLEALCVSEQLPPTLEIIVREYLQHLPSEEVGEAIRVVGRKTDPRKYLTEEILEGMINAGTTLESTSPIHTWMIEHCLRSHKVELIEKMFVNNPAGIAAPITNTMRNLVRNRYDKRLCELIEVVIRHEFMFEEIAMRQEIGKSILAAFEPITAFSFAYECIQIEPQDAVSGLYMLQAAIMSGSPSLILQAADIVFSMRFRSSKIDYASIAIAAIRHQKIDYAKNLLIVNRLASDTRSQRIRIGIPYHIEQNYNTVLKEIENTQSKHLNDPTIVLYEVLALLGLKQYKKALACVNEKVKDHTESLLLRHIIHRDNGHHAKAKMSLNSLMETYSRESLPETFFEDNYAFNSLEFYPSEEKENNEDDTPLVTVIMTVHRWNDFFPLAVSSVLNQTHVNLELIIVDDCSKMVDVKKYDSLLTDERIQRIRMEQNSGTYACRNRGLELARGEYVTFADSDDWNHPNRISDNIKIIQEQDVDLVMGRFIRMDKQGHILFNGSKISQFCLVGVFIKASVIKQYALRFDGRARFSADSEFFERANILLGKHRIHRHSRIDIFALHHNQSLTGGGPNAIDWMGPGETRLRYVSGYRKTHQNLKLNKCFSFDNFPPPTLNLLPDAPNDLHLTVRNLFGVQSKEDTITEPHSLNDAITVFMATYPGGFDTVNDAIKSLLEQTKQVDKIILHVNSNKPPENLPVSSRLEVRLCQENAADNGKFKYMDEFTGYFLTVDDDICYPPDYVEKMLSYVDRYDRTSIIGVHGVVFPTGPPISRWSEYREQRRTHTFTTANSSFTRVNCLGTGTIAFHSQVGIPNFERFDTMRMVDLHIAVWAQEFSIPMFSCPRNINWLTEFDIEHETRIWSQANTESQLQAEMLQTLNKVTKWAALDQFNFKLLNGPLEKLKSWEHRQIPPGMKLPTHMALTPLPEKPKVTVYIPAYNTEKYIVECVDSALIQTYSNIEISIQNGGYADDTLKILNERFSTHDNVIITSKPSTLGEGTNIAIGQGTGELILQLDSDDILHPRAVEMLVDAIGETNICAYGNFSRINQNGENIDLGWEEPLYSRERLMRSMIVHHPRLFRRDAWEFVGGHDENLRNAEDYDFFIKLSELGNFVHLREYLYSYRILEGSASNFSPEVLTANTHLVQNRMLERNQLQYQLTIPDVNQPRNILYKHIAYSIVEDDD
jgi:glycosyltransferase involved in cell wall biosynthesis